MLLDLLDLAALVLVPGGRLVFLLPTTPDFSRDDLPQHPCLRVVACSEQPMTQKISRWMITLEKCQDFSEALRQEFRSANPLDAADRPFARLREKIHGDSLLAADATSEVGKRSSKRKRGQHTGPSDAPGGGLVEDASTSSCPAEQRRRTMPAHDPTDAASAPDAEANVPPTSATTE